MPAELLGGGKLPGGRKRADAADRTSSGGTNGAICGGIQPGIIISGKSSAVVNNMSGLWSALEAVVEESGSETDSSASHGWEELERTCAAMDSNNVQIDCIDLTHMLEEGVAPAGSDDSSEDDGNEDNRGDHDDESTNVAECGGATHFSAAGARPASRLSHTFSPINRLDMTAAVASPPPTRHRRSSFSSASESVHPANFNQSNHADRAARGYEPQVRRDGKGGLSGKYGFSRKYSDSQAQYHSDGSIRSQGSPARRSPEGYGAHSGPLSDPRSGSPFCGVPHGESPHSGPLRHGFGSASSLNSSHSGSPLGGAPRSESLPNGPHTGHQSGPLRHGFGSTSSLNSSHSGSMELGSSYGSSFGGSSFGGSSFGGSSNDLTSVSCGIGLAGSEFKPSPCRVLLRQSSAGDVSPLVSHTPSVTVASVVRFRPTSSGESGAAGERRLAQAAQHKASTAAPAAAPVAGPAAAAATAAGSCKPGGVTVLVKNGANPAAIEAYFKLMAQRGR
ncbi:unnamed protein product [Closterium sp. NIES-53]